MTVFFNHNDNNFRNWVWCLKLFDIAIDFEIDIENVRNTRYRDHGGNSMKRELPKSLFINLMVMK
jgi:hypothetical protein